MKSPPLPKRPAVSRSDPFRRRGAKSRPFLPTGEKGHMEKTAREDIASRAGKTRALYGRRSAPTSSSKGRTGQTRLTDITDAIPTREAV